MPSGLPIMFATVQTEQHKVRLSQTSPPWHSPPLSSCSVSYPSEVYRHTDYFGWQTGGNPGGVFFALSSTDRSRQNPFWGGLQVLMVCDLNLKHVDGNSRLNTRKGYLCVIMPTGTLFRSLKRTPERPTRTTPLLLPIS
jgi:hypothetical protein